MKRKLSRGLPSRRTPMELLEDRRLMSVAPLTINGTSAGDLITINYGLVVVGNTTSAPSGFAAQQLPQTVYNQLTVTINGVVTHPTLASGQSLQINGLGGDDRVTVSGNVFASIDGGAGNDTLIGGSGGDALIGGLGDDILVSGPKADSIIGGPGRDTADYASRTVGVSVTIDNVANDGQSGEGDNVYSDVEVVNGGSANDTLTALAADPLPRTFNGNGGNDLITGGGGDDTLNGGAGNDIIDGGKGNDVIHGGAGNDISLGNDGDDVLFADSGDDFLFGNANDDRLIGGAGTDNIHGGDGDDVLVAIGGGHRDYLYGDLGVNNFWLDAESTEAAVDADPVLDAPRIHRVASYDQLNVNGVNAGTPSREANVGNLPDPGTTDVSPHFPGPKFGYKNFAGSPLFGPNGPVEADVNQGDVGDCYFMASLAAVAQTAPDVIRRSIVDLGDGTFAVQFKRDGVKHFIRVDADFPVKPSGGFAYAYQRSGQNNIWVQVMEKAWAFFRNGEGAYGDASSGYPSEAFDALGLNNDDYGVHGTFGVFGGENEQEFGNHLKSLIGLGKDHAIVLCTNDDGAGALEGDHCYTVDSVNTLNGVPVSVTLRNPWGIDGRGADAANDGFVTFSLQRALAACDRISYANV